MHRIKDILLFQVTFLMRSNKGICEVNIHSIYKHFDLTGSDADADELTWTSDNLPTGAVFTDNTDGTATFTWTPTYTQAGTYSDVQFIVNDNQGGQALMRMKTRR